MEIGLFCKAAIKIAARWPLNKKKETTFFFTALFSARLLPSALLRLRQSSVAAPDIECGLQKRAHHTHAASHHNPHGRHSLVPARLDSADKIRQVKTLHNPHTHLATVRALPVCGALSRHR
jgi:hypothetical protein